MAIARLLVFSLVFGAVFGDPTDWVSVSYVVSQSQNSGRDSTTLEAKKTIVLLANKYAKGSPSNIVDAKGISPPSGNPHDYLSWAPYHWPDCNWCPGGKTHFAHTVDGPNNDSNDNHDASTDASFFSYSLDDPYQYFVRSDKSKSILKRQYNPSSIVSTPSRIRQIPTPVTLPSAVFSVPDEPLKMQTSTGSTTTVGPAQAAAKTTKSSCTPSPTRSIAPSATWTVCPYISRDGRVNPDVRTLHGPDAISTFSQAILYIAMGYALRDEPSLSDKFANFMDTFFVNEETKMNPNVDFGQVVRGPNQSGLTGTFTGVLDLRGLVKVANAVMIVESKKSQHWTSDLAGAFTSWAGEYLKWLIRSRIGKVAATRPNNHATFYFSQVASLCLLLGDRNATLGYLQTYFSNQFLDQIASTGEQPYEAVRTRPYHYRAFNIEAMITNAKLGDQLGANFWTTKSKYGATIQTALDYAMGRDPDGEDISQILPHVAAVAAAYGDPAGKYAAFLNQHDPNYASKSYWFYDQPSALSKTPTSRFKRSVTWKREDALDPPRTLVNSVPIPAPFACPAIFDNSKEVEIDNGIFVTCDQLRPFYELAAFANVELL